MIKIEKIYPRDIIALVVLVFALFIIYKGINSIVSGIVIMIITYYFSKRAYEEKNPNGDLNQRVKKIEGRFGKLSFNKVLKTNEPIKKLPETTHNYHGNLSWISLAKSSADSLPSKLNTTSDVIIIYCHNLNILYYLTD